MVNLDSLFDTLMKDTQNTRNNKVSKILSQKDKQSKNTLELQLAKKDSKFMEVSNSDEYTWSIIGERTG